MDEHILLTDEQFVELALELTRLEERKAEIIADMEPYVRLNGNQKIGRCTAKIKTARKKYDYKTTWELWNGPGNGILLADYIVQPPQPPQPPSYIDYMSAVKDAKIDQEHYVIENIEAVNDVKVVIEVKL